MFLHRPQLVLICASGSGMLLRLPEVDRERDREQCMLRSNTPSAAVLNLHFCRPELLGPRKNLCTGQNGDDSVWRRILSGVHALRSTRYRCRLDAEGRNHSRQSWRIHMEQLGTAPWRISVCLDATDIESPAPSGH